MEKITDKKFKLTPLTAIVFLFVLHIVIAGTAFFVIGIYKLSLALFTDYTFQIIDLVLYTSGFAIISIVAISLEMIKVKEAMTSVKVTTDATASGILHLMRSSRQAKTQTLDGNFFNDILKDIDPNGEVNGSIRVINLEDPTSPPLFDKEFESFEELKSLRDELFSKMLKKEGDFKGKKMTRQEMLDTMTLDELESERIKAEKNEDWTWAIAIRDKINEKNK